MVGATIEGAKRELHPVATMAAGGACGLISWTWCYPVDVVKSRIQAVSYGAEPVTPILRMARHIWAKEGWRGFFVGYSVMAVRSVPVNAATFYGYESALSLLGG